MLPFLRYAVLSVPRNRRRSIYALIGIALALSMVTGSFIAIDSSSISMLRSATESVSVDFVAEKNPWTGSIIAKEINETLAAIKSVQYVTHSTPLIIQYGLSMRNPAENLTYFSQHGGTQAIMLPERPDGFLESFKITGTVPAAGTVAVSQHVADILNISVGGSLQLQGKKLVSIFDENETFVRVETQYVNISYEVSQIWTQNMPVLQDGYSTSHEESLDTLVVRDMANPVIMNITDGPGLIEQLKAFGATDQFLQSQMYYYVWIDHDSVISIADIPGTVVRLEFIYNRLSLKGQSLDLYVENSELAGALQSLDPQLSTLKALALALSLPVIALGIYLSLVGVDLGTTGRQREVGILKSRGASNRQVFGALMMESAFVGVIASVIGLLLGLVVSRFLLQTATTFGATDSSMEGTTSWTDLRVSPWTVILSILFGVMLMLLSTRGPFKRMSNAPVTQALHHYSPVSTQTSYNPGLDVALIGVSSLSIVSVFFGMDAAYGRGFSWLTESILTIALVAGVVLFPIMPFFLSMGIVRFMTMSPKRLYSRLTAFVRPWTKELTYLVNRNIVRNPRRAANLGVIISLALAFGLFISVTMESTFAQERESVKYQVGADVNISGKSMNGQPVSYPSIAAADDIKGVVDSSHYIVIPASCYFGPTTLAILNSSRYMDTVSPGDFYFIGHSKRVLEDLEKNGTCLLSKAQADEHDILEGDVLVVKIAWVSQEGAYRFTRIQLDLRVIGIVKALPGLTDSSIFIDSRTVSSVPFGNMSASQGLLGVFLKVSDNSDPRQVANAAQSVYASQNVNTTAVVFQERLDSLGNDPTYRAISDFLYTQYALALIIMSVGVGLIIFVAVSDREHELACIMARGSSRSQMRRMLMGESVSLMSLGLIVGASVGILTAYLFNTLWGMESAQFDRQMVFTGVSWMVLVISILSLLVASLMATSRAGKVRLAEVLRIRGG